jgi:hypothetical protein
MSFHNKDFRHKLLLVKMTLHVTENLPVQRMIYCLPAEEQQSKEKED